MVGFHRLVPTNLPPAATCATGKTLADQLLKKKPGELTEKDFNAFGNEDMDKVQALIEKTVDTLDKIANAKWVAPTGPDGGAAAYEKVVKAAFDTGDPKSKEVKAAAAAWGKICSKFRDELLEVSVPIRVAKAELPGKIQSVQAAYTIVASLEPILDKCMKIPMPSGTAQNAELFGMFNQVQQVMAGCNQILSRLIAIQDQNFDAYTELSDIMKQNDKWIASASRISGMTKEQIAKNAKAKEPR